MAENVWKVDAHVHWIAFYLTSDQSIFHEFCIHIDSNSMNFIMTPALYGKHKIVWMHEKMMEIVMIGKEKTETKYEKRMRNVKVKRESIERIMPRCVICGEEWPVMFRFPKFYFSVLFIFYSFWVAPNTWFIALFQYFSGENNKRITTSTTHNVRRRCRRTFFLPKLRINLKSIRIW